MIAGVQTGDAGAMDDAQARQSQLNIRFQAWLARTEALIKKVSAHNCVPCAA